VTYPPCIDLAYKFLLENHIKTKIITHEYKQLSGKYQQNGSELIFEVQ